MKTNRFDILKERILKTSSTVMVDHHNLCNPARNFEKVRSMILSCTHYDQTITCRNLIKSYQRINQLRDDDTSVKILLDILRVKAEGLTMPVWTADQLQFA